jgi:hypothetical protein
VATAALLTSGGCVRRTLMITSDPPGALVWLNDREVGRTPLEVDFLHYGTYDVRLELEGREPLLTSGRASPPWWDLVPLDLVAELVPGEPRSRIVWHYVLDPVDTDVDALAARAREMRARALGEEAAEANGSARTQTPRD